MKINWLLSFTVVLVLAVVTQAAFTWTTAVDNYSTTTNSLRSVAVNESSVYIGYIQTSGSREVEQHNTASPYSTQNSLNTTYNQPKGIAYDSRGYVAVGSREGSGSYSAVLRIYNNDLTQELGSLNGGIYEFGGVATYSSGGQHYLYQSQEASGGIRRYNITDLQNITLDTSFGTGGIYTLAQSLSGKLRGIEVSADGTIFVASRDDSKIYRISSDLSSVTSASVERAMDVAIFGGKVYATSYNGTNSLISTFDVSDLGFVENININILDGNIYSRGTAEGWSGIDIGSDGRIWVADQLYGTSKDRLLVSSAIPEPITLALLGLGGLLLRRSER